MTRTTNKINFTHTIDGVDYTFTNIPVIVYQRNGSEEVYVRMRGVSSVVRQYIKQRFPKLKYTISSDSYSMGDSVRVRVTDLMGYDQQDVQKMKWVFQEGYFDGMNDIYEYSNGGIQTRLPNGQVLTFGTKYFFTFFNDVLVPYDTV